MPMALDRWAAQWVAAVDAGIEDKAVWRGLCKLAGIDLRYQVRISPLGCPSPISAMARRYNCSSADVVAPLDRFPGSATPRVS